MKNTMKDLNALKDELTKASARGYKFFLKNVLMIILIVIMMLFIFNSSLVTNPREILKDFNPDSLWGVFVLFLTVTGFYQLSKSVEREKTAKTKEDRIDEYEEAITRKEDEAKRHHADMVLKRFEIGPLISNELKNLLINLDADRAAILEMHNGTNNASGLPFIYGDMVYEEISPRIGFASDEFKNFNLAKLPFVALHYSDRTWIGSVDEIEKEDAYLAAKLRVVEVNYGAFVVLEGINGPLGFLTLFFKSPTQHPTKAKIIAELNHSSQILSTLLDKAKD